MHIKNDFCTWNGYNALCEVIECNFDKIVKVYVIVHKQQIVSCWNFVVVEWWVINWSDIIFLCESIGFSFDKNVILGDRSHKKK